MFHVRGQTVYYVNCQKSDWASVTRLTSDREFQFSVWLLTFWLSIH